jgi:hypothetical protein
LHATRPWIWKGSTMSRKSGAVAGNMRASLDQLLERDYGTVLRQILISNREELLWIAEVMAGSRQAGEQCITEATELAEAAQYVGREWILPWIKRLLVHVALKNISGEIRELLPSARSLIPVKLVRIGLSAMERQKLRSLSPQQIIASHDVLERACLILPGYLRYPLLDCALLLGCPRDWIEPICDRAFTKVLNLLLSAQDQLQGIDSFVSTGVMGCQAD